MSPADAATKEKLRQRIAGLSPEKRKLLEARLRSEGLDRQASRSVPRRGPERDRTWPLGPYPLSWGMQRLWFVDRMVPGSTAYNIPFAGRLKGEIDPGVLAGAFREVVRRHEILRTRFADEAGMPVQLIDPPPDGFHLPVVDLAAVPAPLRDVEAERLVDADPQVPFDLATGPVIRVSLVHLAVEGETAPALHDLIVTMPHIVTDAWSMAVLFRELPPLYDALREGRPSPLPELPIQVADYALWQRDWLDGPRMEEEMEFWRGHLSGAPVVLELPTDRPRPPVQNLRGRRYYLDLTPEEFAAVGRLAEAENATVFMVLLAAFNLLLMRWSGQRDQLIGTPIATRSQPESHGLIGFFIDNAVVRTRLAGDPTFAELVERVKTASLATFGHGDLPFDKVVEAVGVERDLSRPPMIQQIFVYQNVHIPEPDFEGIELVSSQQTDARAARFELTLGMFDWKGGLRGGFEYAEALWDRSTMVRMADHYRNLLLDGLAHPGRRLSELRALAPEERRQVLVEGNRRPPAAGPGEPPATVDGRIRDAAVRWPGAVAVGDAAGRELTYADLVAAGDRLAARLRAEGVGLEEPVAVLAERSPEMVVAAFAVLAAGGVYMPLDPAQPAERLAGMLGDAGVRVALTAGLDEGVAQEVTAGLEAALPGELTFLAVPGGQAANGGSDTPAAPPRANTGPADGARLAALIYTSGSTGRPKGVGVPHAGLVNMMEMARRAYDLAPGDRMAQILAVGFDAANLEMLPPLAAGARLEPFGRETVLGGPALVAELARRRVTVLIGVPSLLASLPEGAAEGLPGLRLLISGGEKLPPVLAARWAEGRAGGRRVFNSYGPTEASVVACQQEVGELAAALLGGGADFGAVEVGEGVVDGEGHPPAVAHTHTLPTEDAPRRPPAPQPEGEREPQGEQGPQDGEAARDTSLLIGRGVARDGEQRGGDEGASGGLAEGRRGGGADFGAVEVGEGVVDGEGHPPAVAHKHTLPTEDAPRRPPAPRPEGGRGPQEEQGLQDREAARDSSLSIGRGRDRVGERRGEGDGEGPQGGGGGQGPSLLIGRGVARVGEAGDGERPQDGGGGQLPSLSIGRGRARAGGRVDQPGEVGEVGGSLPFGAPVEGQRAYVVDREGHAAPIGVPGELLLGGVGLARGYVGRPGATAEAFVPHPWAEESGEAGARLYRTGDLARRLPADATESRPFRSDGFEYLGRIDAQVKVRGQRIELGEVEATLAALPGVGAAAAALRTDPGGRGRLVGYVVAVATPAGGDGVADLSEAALRTAMAQRLPEAMVPAAFVHLPSLPRLGSGKLDRAALPEPAWQASAGGAPRTAMEETLAGVWRELLGVESVGPDDDFFALGGDSIASIQMISRAAAEGVHLTPQQVFGHPTLAGLARVAEEGDAAEGAGAARPAPPEHGRLELLPTQRWFFALGLEEPHHWNMSTLLRGTEPLAPGPLAAALAAVVARHEALRAVFPAADGGAPEHAEAPPPAATPARPPRVDLGALAEPRADAERRRVAGRHQATLDLAASPLRPLLFPDLRGDRLLLTLHHLAVDAVSWRVLWEDLETAYRQAAQAVGKAQPGRNAERGPVRLPTPPTSRKAWGEALAAWAESGEAAQAWRRRRAEIDRWQGAGTALPGGDDPADPEAAAARQERTLTEAETAALAAAAEAWGVEVEHLVLTALVEAVAEWSGERALTVDLEGHGRRPAGATQGGGANDVSGADPGDRALHPAAADLSRTVGWLTVFEPMLFDLRRVPADRPGEAVAAVAREVRRARGRDWPFSVLAWSGAAEEGDDRSSPSRVSFNYFGRVDALLGAAALFSPETEPPRPLRGPANRRPHALETGGWISGGRLSVNLRHGRRHDVASMAALLDRVAGGLRSLAAAGAVTGAARGRRAGGPEMGAGARPVVREMPLSVAQERLWFLDRLEPGNPAYNVSAPTRLEGRLDVAAMARALDGVARRHEILRTTFPLSGDGPVQRVHAPGPVPLPRVDLSALPAGRLEAEEGRVLRRRSSQLFDLAHGPLLRGLLLDLGTAEDPGTGEDGAGRWDLHLGLHHVAVDGWSVSLLVREVAALYAAHATGTDPGLPEPGMQYGDVALRERRRLQREEAAGEGTHARQIAYWRQRLDGLPAAVDLPTDRPRPPRVTYRGGERGRTLTPALSDAVRGLAREAGASPFMVFLAALELLVGRLSGQRDFAIGSPIAGRGAEDTQATLGLFLNHLVLRSDLPAAGDGGSFRQLLGRVRRTALDAFSHAEVPFERVVEAVEPERDLSRTPLFQVFLNMLNFPAPEADLPGLRLTPLSTTEARAMFEWTLYVKEMAAGGGGAFHLELLYNADLFDAATIDGALAQLEALLDQAVGDPDRPLREISLRTIGAVSALPDPGALLDDSWPGTVTAAVERRAAGDGARPALVSRAEAGAGGRVTYSYAELASAVRRLHRSLAAAGVRRGDRVAVHGHREAALPAAMLATHRAGAAFLLLDPAHPAPRNAAAVELAAPRVLLTLAGAGDPPAEVVAAVTRGGGRVLEIPPLAGLLAGPEGDPPPPVPVSAFDAAVVTFTSGSTGVPKGVVGLHRSLTHFLPWQAEHFGLGEGDVFSLLSGLAHDPLQREVFTALWAGATLALPDAEEVHRPGRLAAWMADEGVTVAHLTPAMAQLLCEISAAPGGDAEDGAGGAALPALGRVFYLGDALTRATAERVFALAPAARAANLYGSTETQRAVAWQPVPRPAGGGGGTARAPGVDRMVDRVVALGRGMPDVQLLVRRPGGGLCGVGEVGEIHVRSPHLAGGYLGRSAATAERFLPDAGDGAPGGRVYRTGDLGRYRRDGGVEPLGRADRQVKVRGHRIEPGEVESALERHPAVARAAVLARGAGGDLRLVAWWVPAPGGSADGEAAGEADVVTDADLRAFLAARLPEAMVPAAFVRLDSFPLTPNRKLDRAALPDPPEELAGAAAEPPATPTELALAAIWGRVLAGAREAAAGEAGAGEDGAADAAAFGRHDDFFARGGHSLKLVQVLARVSAELGVDLPVRTVFEHPTLAGMAAAIDRAVGSPGDGGGTLPPLEPAPRDRPLPVSFAQQRLVFLDRLAPGGSAYNVPAGLDLRGGLDVAALHAAFLALVERHEALRTTFGEAAGELVQVVAPAWRPRLPRVDLAALPAARRRDEASRLARVAVAAPFDLARGPLLRLRLLHLGTGEAGAGDRTADGAEHHRLLLVLHHAVTDGWSMGLLLGEAGRLYTAITAGEPGAAGDALAVAALSPLPVQYADFAVWQRSWLRGEALDRQLDFWRTRLEGVEPLELPTDRPRTGERGRAGRLQLDPGRDLQGRLERRAAELSATPFVLLLTAYQAFLARYSGQGRFAVGTAVANRRHPALEGVVGFFANTLALPATVAGDPTFARAATAVREVHLGALAHQDLPFEKLVSALGPFRDTTRQPLVQVMLVLHNTPAALLGSTSGGGPGAARGGVGRQVVGHGPARVELEPALLDAGTSRVELGLSFAPGAPSEAGGGALRGLLEYDEALFDRATAERMAAHFRRLLEAALERPGDRLSTLPLLSVAERDHLLARAAGPVVDGGVVPPAREVGDQGVEGAGEGGPAFHGGLHAPFFARAAADPGAVAVADGGLEWTYGELAARARSVAAELRRLGVGAGGSEPRVGVLMRRSAQQVAAVLGTLAAGGAWVPLDPALPRRRLAVMARDAGLAAVLHDGEGDTGDDAAGAAELVADAGLPATVIDVAAAGMANTVGAAEEAGEAGRGPATVAAAEPACPDALAYVFYTSGTTGRPKGVMVTHGDAAHRVADAVHRFRLDDDSVFMQVISPSFDPWVMEVFAALSAGSRLVVASRDALRDGAVLRRELVAAGATALASVPSLLAETPSHEVESLRVVSVGGEPCPPEVARRWAALGTPHERKLLNFYGPTEATITVTAGEGPGEGDAGPPLGEPLEGARVHVVPLGGAPPPEPQPAGVPGELVVAGVGLARGYLGRPAETAAVFQPDPWGPPGSRLYRTGDRAVRAADGELRLLGRVDHQVKVRGNRVELAEVEAVLNALPGVREAAVSARRAGRRAPGAPDIGFDRLVGWFVPEREALGDAVTTDAVTTDAVTADTVTAELARRVPPYMVPTPLVAVDALPRNPSGKLDRAALDDLPVPAAGVAESGVAGEDGHVPPRTPSERLLAALWCEVLGVERVGAEDDFFDLGGHSLAAMRLASRLREEAGVELPLVEVFARPTLAAVARSLDRLTGEAAGDKADGEAGPPPLRPLSGEERRGPIPASFAQERLWFLDRLRPGDSAYNVPAAVWLAGDLRPAALAGALAEIVRRHDVLRTTFDEVAGRPVQRVAPALRPGSWRLPRVDLAGLPAGRRRAAAEAAARRLAREPFDLHRGPLLRPALVHLGPDTGETAGHLLSLTLHHAVCDEWSVAVFLGELNTLYRAAATGRPSPLPELPVQFADFAAWQRGWLEGEALERRLEAWRDYLEGVPPATELPEDRPVAGDPGRSAGGRVPLAPSPQAADGVRTLARRLGATPFHVVLAAVFALLGRYGNRDAVVGTPVANRGPLAAEDLIGFFVNTLPLRARPRSEVRFTDLVDEVRRSALTAMAGAEVPYERIVAAAAPAAVRGGGEPGAAPLLRVMLAFHEAGRVDLDLPGVEGSPLALDNGGAKMDLLFQVGEGPAGLGGELEYSAALFSRPAAERVAGHFRRLLAAAVERPGTPLGDLPLLSAAEGRQLLEEWRGGLPRPGDSRAPGDGGALLEAPAGTPARTLIDHFAGAAGRAPRAVAVVAGEERLSYGELAVAATRLANHLRRLGAGPGHRVALRLPPGADLVAAILGVLGSGAAYVPLDPEWPEARAAAVLADAGCRLLVSDRPAPRGEGGEGEGAASGVRHVRPGDAAGASPVPPPRTARADDLAYVIYTSGSTGRPKGVGVSHRNVARLLTACRGHDFGAGDVWTLFHSAAFDFSVWELWGALAHAGRLVVVPRDVARSPAAFLDLLAAERVTVLNQTPSAFAQLDREDAARAAAGRDDAAAGADLSALRLVIFGGEALDPASLAGWFRRHGDRHPRLVNMYGITETTVHVTERLMTTGDAEAAGAAPGAGRGGSPIGAPLADLAAYVVDPRGRPVPAGVAGELWVGGPGLARGYLGRPALTARRFVPDPFAQPSEAGRRLYRSGDRVRWGAGGELFYLGRIDQQVQIRGFRVEPGEVESALAALPRVAAAAVVPRDDLPGGPGLVAWVVASAEAGEGVEADRLKRELRRRLPEYMVPARVESLDALPLTVNGKVDRGALARRPLSGAGPELSTRYAAPRGPVEEVVAGAWAEALEVERVGRDDSFFDLGGHSLLATRMVSWARDAFGVELPLAGLFAEPTVAGMAAALVAGGEADEVRRGAELMLELAGLDEAEVGAGAGDESKPDTRAGSEAAVSADDGDA